MRKAGQEITLSEVDEFVKAKRTHQLHTKTRDNIQGHIVTFSKNSMWFADLLDMQNFSRSKKRFGYILLCIDVFTRKGHAQPLKSKAKISVRDGFSIIFQDLETPIRLIITDYGKELLNRDVQDFLKQLKIKHVTVEVGDHHALRITDRFSGTLKEKIFKDFTEYNTVVWYNKLQGYIYIYIYIYI